MHDRNRNLIFPLLAFVTLAAGAMIFAAHPLQIETVGWVSGMKDLLGATFVLLAVWQYLLFARARGTGTAGSRLHFFLGIAFMVFGMLSKPIAVVTPVLVA